MNASLGSITSRHVGPVAAEDEDIAGEYLHRLSKTYNLCFPSTMDQCHTGPSHTYVQKHGGQLCRPDFVAVPIDWTACDVSSYTAPDIHAAHSTPDHIAAFVQVRATFRAPPARSGLSRRTLPIEALTHPSNRDVVAQILREGPVVNWNVSVHAHAAILTRHVQEGLTRISQHSQRRPHHPYLSETTWELQGRVACLRRALHRLTDVASRSDLASGFYAWSQRLPLSFIFAQGRLWFLRAQRVKFSLHRELRALCKQLRKACRRDRDCYISELARTIATAPTKEAFAAYHRILAHRRKKAFRLEPLPGILKTDGEPCADAVEVQQRWRQQFAGLEAGLDTTFNELTQRTQAIGPSAVFEHPLDVSEVPSLPLLRRILASTKSGKASGMDSIPPELNRYFADESADLLYPLLLKFLWRGEEALGHKGGQAVILYKGRGPTDQCSSYRSILLMNTWAKAFHQSIRPAIKTVFEASAPALQLGGRAGCSVALGSHVLRSLARYAHQHSLSGYVLYADISAAFYSALVQLVAHSEATTCPEALMRAMHGLQLPAEAQAELTCALRDPSVLSQLGASPWLEKLAAHLGPRRWQLVHGSRRCHTSGYR